jgi:hypothetical protein
MIAWSRTRRSASGMLWHAVAAGGRTPLLVCVLCHAREVNETNRLRRGGWQETAGGPRLFRCGTCAEHEGAPTREATPPRGSPCGPSPAGRPPASSAYRDVNANTRYLGGADDR